MTAERLPENDAPHRESVRPGHGSGRRTRHVPCNAAIVFLTDRMRRKTSIGAWIAAASLATLAGRPLPAEILILKTAQTLEAASLSYDGDVARVRLETGAELKIPLDQIDSVLPTPPGAIPA